jgi:hypothetical protein
VGFTEVRGRREIEREMDGKVLLHISGRVLLKSGGVQREIERGTDRYYFTYLGGFS